MLAAADLPGADLRLQDLRDPLPDGPFDLVFSALAIHHLDAAAKADLFARVAAGWRQAGASSWPTSSCPRIRPTS